MLYELESALDLYAISNFLDILLGGRGEKGEDFSITERGK